MKTFSAIILAAALVSTAAAEAGPPSPAVPQPRLRLDPARQTAVVESVKPPKSGSSDSVVAMSPYVVRSTRIAANEAEQHRLPTGPISLLSGGWIYRRDIGVTHLEVGVWPYQNILWKSDRFKSDLKHVGTEFVRVSW